MSTQKQVKMINVTCVALLKDILRSFLQTNKIKCTFSVPYQNTLCVLFRVVLNAFLPT